MASDPADELQGDELASAIFQMLDTGGDGTIGFAELKAALLKMNPSLQVSWPRHTTQITCYLAATLICLQTMTPSLQRHPVPRHPLSPGTISHMPSAPNPLLFPLMPHMLILMLMRTGFCRMKM